MIVIYFYREVNKDFKLTFLIGIVLIGVKRAHQKLVNIITNDAVSCLQALSLHYIILF